MAESERGVLPEERHLLLLDACSTPRKEQRLQLLEHVHFPLSMQELFRLLMRLFERVWLVLLLFQQERRP